MVSIVNWAVRYLLISRLQNEQLRFCVVSVWDAGNGRIIHILLNLDSSVFTQCLPTLNTTFTTTKTQRYDMLCNVVKLGICEQHLARCQTGDLMFLWHSSHQTVYKRAIIFYRLLLKNNVLLEEINNLVIAIIVVDLSNLCMLNQFEHIFPLHQAQSVWEDEPTNYKETITIKGVGWLILYTLNRFEDTEIRISIS